MMDLLNDDLRRDPFPMYEMMRESSPVLLMPDHGIWGIFDYDGVKRALTDHASFSSEVTPPTGKAPPWLVFSDPPRHTKLRGIISRAFTPKSISNLEPRIRQLSRELLDACIERGEMDLVADYSGPLATLVMAEMIGIPLEERARFIRWSEVIMNLSYSVTGGAEAAKAIKEHADTKLVIQAYLPDVLEDRRASPKDDLLTRLVQAEVDGERLTHQEIVDFFQLLLAAGTETSTNLISNAIICFNDHPEQLAKLRAEPERLAAAIEEVTRYRSPGQMFFRQTRADVELNGQTIPRGKLVLVVIGAANRDPKYFKDPHVFDITRDPNPHISFGHGIHFCLGAPLARLEAKVALPDLLQRLEGLQLANDGPWAPRKALNTHGPASLPVRFTPGRRVA